MKYILVLLVLLFGCLPQVDIDGVDAPYNEALCEYHKHYPMRTNPADFGLECMMVGEFIVCWAE